MPKITRVQVQEFVAAGKKYVDGQAAKADADRDGTLTATEAKKLSADLQDNFELFAFKAKGTVSTEAFAKETAASFAAWGEYVGGRLGYLDEATASALPSELQDNFASYLRARNAGLTTVGELTTTDETPRGLAAEHVAKYGAGKLSYEQAFTAALEAAFGDSEEGALRYLVREMDFDDEEVEDSVLDAAVRKALAEGSVRLIGTDEDIPTGESNEENWIFSIDTDSQGDHGVWAIVDRQTGAAHVTSFN